MYYVLNYEFLEILFPKFYYINPKFLNIMQSSYLSKRDISAIQAILKALKSDPNSDEFLKPVDYKGLNLYDYTTVIKKPMDLDTVTKNFKAGKYRGFQKCMKDVDLIWTNCMTYNREDSGIYEEA